MKRFCLIGEHLSHSLSAVIHTRLFELLGVQGRYDLRELSPAEAASAAQRLTGEGYDGFNVTIPYKEVILPQLSGLSPEAAAIGAVNTVAAGRPPLAPEVHLAHRLAASRGSDNGAPSQPSPCKPLAGGPAEGEQPPTGTGLYGYNTDYAGFGQMLQSAGIDPAGGVAAVLGTGGAYRAAAAWLLDCGVKRLYAVTRRPSQAGERARLPGWREDDRLQVIGYDAIKGIAGALVVNATPVGMFPHTGVSPVGEQILSKFDAAADLIYNPRETEFLRLARQVGKPAVNGLTMLVAQAVAAQEIWLGRSIDPAVVGALTAELAGRF